MKMVKAAFCALCLVLVGTYYYNREQREKEEGDKGTTRAYSIIILEDNFSLYKIIKKTNLLDLLSARSWRV
jgi:hypothetical protein